MPKHVFRYVHVHSLFLQQHDSCVYSCTESSPLPSDYMLRHLSESRCLADQMIGVTNSMGLSQQLPPRHVLGNPSMLKSSSISSKMDVVKIIQLLNHYNCIVLFHLKTYTLSGEQPKVFNRHLSLRVGTSHSKPFQFLLKAKQKTTAVQIRGVQVCKTLTQFLTFCLESNFYV